MSEVAIKTSHQRPWRVLWTANGKRIIVIGLRYTFRTLTWIESFGMRWNSSTVWIILVYIAFGSRWIILSDGLLDLVARDPA